MKRGALKKSEARLINFCATVPLIEVIQECVKIEDSDQSKFIRNAIRARARKYGVREKATALTA